MDDNQNSETGTPLTEQAKQQAQQAVQQGQQMATHVWELARTQFRSQLNGQKERAATSITDFADVLRQTGSQLREQGKPGGSYYAEQAADRITQFSSALQQKEIEELIADTESFARARPALFLSIATLLGVVLARFLKSSSPNAGAAA